MKKFQAKYVCDYVYVRHCMDYWVCDAHTHTHTLLKSHSKRA